MIATGLADMLARTNNQDFFYFATHYMHAHTHVHFKNVDPGMA